MFMQKSNLFTNLSKNQRASLISFLRNFAKKHNNMSTQDIIEAFIEEESYYFEVKNPHFEWIIPYFEENAFLKELEYLISQYKFQLEQKQLQKPFIERQKVLMKEQRKKAQEYKLSKEKPTEKQVKYYNRLCKKYEIELQDTQFLSKLDLKNMISEILEKEHKKSTENIDKRIKECSEKT